MAPVLSQDLSPKAELGINSETLAGCGTASQLPAGKVTLTRLLLRLLLACLAAVTNHVQVKHPDPNSRTSCALT